MSWRGDAVAAAAAAAAPASQPPLVRETKIFFYKKNIVKAL